MTSDLDTHEISIGRRPGWNTIQESERAKVLQSIASVIQALPPMDEIGPVEVRIFKYFGRCGRV